MEVVAKFLTEEWSYEALTACAAVYRMCAAPCPFPCIEYPAQTDNTQIKSSRQIDLTKVSQYCHSCLCLYCIGLPHHNVFNPVVSIMSSSLFVTDQVHWVFVYAGIHLDLTTSLAE